MIPAGSKRPELPQIRKARRRACRMWLRGTPAVYGKSRGSKRRPEMNSMWTYFSHPPIISVPLGLKLSKIHKAMRCACRMRAPWPSLGGSEAVTRRTGRHLGVPGVDLALFLFGVPGYFAPAPSFFQANRPILSCCTTHISPSFPLPLAHTRRLEVSPHHLQAPQTQCSHLFGISLDSVPQATQNVQSQAARMFG